MKRLAAVFLRNRGAWQLVAIADRFFAHRLAGRERWADGLHNYWDSAR